MRHYDRNEFKLSFLKYDTQFHVNEKERIITCIVKCILNTPYCYESPTYIKQTRLKGVGIAKCSNGDSFDKERGKRIALAKAENRCYKQAVSYLNENKKHIEFILNEINNFTKKSNKQCEHNLNYIDTISDIDNPEYRTDIKPLKYENEI
jgi:hypothetical protein